MSSHLKENTVTLSSDLDWALHVPHALHSSGVALSAHADCEQFGFPDFWVGLVLGRAALFALPPSLPAAPIPAVLNS